MPVYYHSSSRKSNGFSIDDIIKTDDLPRTSNQSLSYLPPITWLPSPTSIYQFQRESMLQYLRHANQFTSIYFRLVFPWKNLMYLSRSRSSSGCIFS
jgi:hypothetical protein